MAKVFIVLLSALVVLNGMTFLVVVNQTAPPTQGAPSQADAAGKKPQGSDPTLQKLESLERTVQGVKGSMDRLSSKVDGLQSKVNQVASRPAAAPAVTQSLPPPSGGSGRPSAVRGGRVDYSRITTPQAQPAAPAHEEATDEEGQAPADGTQSVPDQQPPSSPDQQPASPDQQPASPDQPPPAPQPAVEGTAEGTEEGSGQPQPAPDAPEGGAPGAPAQGESP